MSTLLRLLSTSLLLSVAVAAHAPQAQQAQPQQQPSAPTAPPAPTPAQPGVPTQKPAQPRSTRPSTPAATTLHVEVTDRTGSAVSGAAVALAGPVERTGVSGDDGSLIFRGLRPGTYRLRFEHEAFTTLERELTIRAGQPATVAAALTARPAEEAPPPEPAPAPAPDPAPRPARTVEARSLSIPDFLDKNLIGGQPQKMTLLACAEGGTSQLLQVRDPLQNQEHADVDEILYVVAGSGVIRLRDQDVKAAPGHFMLVPRGIVHSIRRDGRNPVILLSILTGSPCDESTAPAK